MQILDGQAVAQEIKARIRQEAQEVRNRRGRPPHLGAILVGHDPASQTYVASKVKTCHELGFRSTLVELEEDCSQKALEEVIDRLNADPEVDGILLQLPLPSQIHTDDMLARIDPKKDVDGFHPISQGRMVLGQPGFLPATPFGILLLLEHYQIPVAGKDVVVIGRSSIVGTPMSLLFSRPAPFGNATVTLCHSHTRNLEEKTRQADLIVVAIGKPGFLKGDMVKEGAIVIDVGINRMNDPSRKSGYRLVGDADFDSLKSRCAYITPVPRGVGPMTICGLMMNTLKAAAADPSHSSS